VVGAAWIETYYQQRVDDRLLGRVLGVAENTSAAGILVGIGAASLVAVPFGPVVVLIAAAGVLFLSAVIAAIALGDARTMDPSESKATDEQLAAYGG
jgi:hypothetical protein